MTHASLWTRRWLSGKGGTVQFIAVGRDAFVFSQVSDASGSVSMWTASRQGASAAAAEGSDAPARRSMLQRYGKWLGFLALYLAYRTYQERAAPKQKAS